MKEKRIRLAVIAAVIFLVLFFLVKNRTDLEPDRPESFMKTEDFSANESVKKTTYFVYLSGEVLHPGVYEADPDDRIYDVIEKAGGFLSGAKEDAVNLASKVKDGMHIHIPPALSDSDPKEQKVNVNTADVDALMSLPNIGASKAEAIVRYRKEHGLFVSEEDLLLVPGIGNALMESIRDRITF